MKDDLGSLQAVLGSAGDGNRLCYEGCHVQSLLRMGEPVQSVDMRTRTKTGRPVWLNVSILSMNDAAGEKVAVHLFRDVTATKEHAARHRLL